MTIHNHAPKDYSGMITVNIFGKQDYEVARDLEEKGVQETWIYNLDKTRVVSYRK